MVARNRSISINFSGHSTEKEELEKKGSLLKLKEVYSLVKYEWPQCLQPESNPIEMALSLLDNTSVGLAYRLDDFESMSQQTQSTLRQVVNDNHEMFNNTVGSYHLLYSMINASKENSHEIKDILEEATANIQTRSDTLADLSQTSMRYTEMQEILEAMEKVTAMPEKIDKLLLEKKIHEIYDMISEAYQLAEKYSMWTLSAMSSIKDHLEIQSNNLFDIIVDELQNELYLKNISAVDQNNSTQISSIWKDINSSNRPQLSSFKIMINESNSLESFIYNTANISISEVADFICNLSEDFIANDLPRLEQSEKTPSIISSAPKRNEQSFAYIYMLLDTASKLNRLSQVIEILEGQHSQELFSLMRRVTEETKSQNSVSLSKLSKLKNIEQSTALEALATNTLSDASVLILKDFFSNLFIRSLLVLQKHQVVYEITRKIHFRDSSLRVYDFDSVWTKMTKSLRGLMINYIYETRSQNIFGSISSKDTGFQPYGSVMGKKKQLFKFDDVAFDTTTNLSMDKILADMFPGFNISESNDKGILKVSDANANLNTESLYIKGETFNTSIKILVPSNVFNMRIILDFFLLFISGSQTLLEKSRVSSHLGVNYSGSSFSFFNGYMREAFFPRLKEYYFKIYSQIMNNGQPIDSSMNDVVGSDISTFRVGVVPLNQVENDRYFNFASSSSHSFATIYQNALEFKRLFINACYSLNTSLTYREEYSKLCLDLLQKFAKSYFNFYTALIAATIDDTQTDTNSSSDDFIGLKKCLKTPALVQVSKSIIEASNDTDSFQVLIDEEMKIFLHGRGVQNPESLLSNSSYLSQDSLTQICNLYITSSWILTWLPLMKSQSDYVAHHDFDGKQLAKVDMLKHEWTFLENGFLSNLVLEKNHLHVRLALNAEVGDKFDSVIETFTTVKDNSLLALRYDIRCKALYYMRKSFALTEWALNVEPGDPDKFISALSKSIFSFDLSLGRSLTQKEKDQVFSGLPKFLSNIMVEGSYAIKKINPNGIKRALLNILTLKQVLRNILREEGVADFNRASLYYELCTTPEHQIVDTLINRKYNYSKQESRNLARLIYSERLSQGGSSINKAKYAELLRKLEDISQNSLKNLVGSLHTIE